MIARHRATSTENHSTETAHNVIDAREEFTQGSFTHSFSSISGEPHISTERLRDALCKEDSLIIPGTERWTGSGAPIGSGKIFNTPGATKQLLLLLSLSDHPAVHRVAEGQAGLDLLCSEKPLKGMRAIDLGCGIVPSFARCARALGAEVITMDVIGPDLFGGRKSAEDVQYHIVADFSSGQAWRIVPNAWVHKVDLVTHSCTVIGTGIPTRAIHPTMLKVLPWDYDEPMFVISGAPPREEIARMLKPGGMFFNSEDSRDTSTHSGF
jgi:hypothetical protein